MMLSMIERLNAARDKARSKAMARERALALKTATHEKIRRERKAEDKRRKYPDWIAARGLFGG